MVAVTDRWPRDAGRTASIEPFRSVVDASSPAACRRGWPATCPASDRLPPPSSSGWLARPEQQARWHEETGYFPIHERAIDELAADGWFDGNPHFATASERLRETEDTVATRGARIGPFDTVRTMIEEGYEEMSDGQPVDEALDRLTDEVERELAAYRNSDR